jgi:hypothetical protein
MIRTSLFMVVCLGVAAVASAQTSPVSFGGSGAGDGITGNAFANVSFIDDQQRPATPASRPAAKSTSDRQVFGRAQVGLVFTNGSTGVDFGAGITAQPFTNQSNEALKRVEILVDGNFIRLGGYNYLYISGNGVYDFELANAKVTPYAGAGIGILHATGSTETRLQILGGIKVPMQNKMEFLGELRFLFTSYYLTTFLLGGIRF